MGPFSPAEYFWLIGLGFLVGLYGTLIGAGGGFILMPILLLRHPQANPEQLTAISLAAAIFLFLRPAVKPHEVSPHLHHPQVSRHLKTSVGEPYDYNFNPLVGIGISFGVGYISSFLGIGGGIIRVPALTYFLDFPVHIATATSHFILAIMALTGTLVHIWTGTFHEGARHTLSLSIGALLGAPLGAYLSSRIRGPWIIRGLALALGLVGIRILILLVQL